MPMPSDKGIRVADPDSQFLELAVAVFSVLADETRVRIILGRRVATRQYLCGFDRAE
jgi:hypothetical protein